MQREPCGGRPVFHLLWLACAARLCAADTFTVATYNLENFLDAATATRPAKTDAAKAKVRESLRALKADVLGLQEMGGTNALLELRASLRAEGLDYPYWEHLTSRDPDIHVAVLSRFPFAARRPHTNDYFLLTGRRFQVSRGFAEVEVQVNPQYSFTLLVVHLKSKRPVPEADEADWREQEALLLREKINARLAARPDANLVVIGDLNDTKDSKPVKAVIGHGKDALVDTRPAECNGDSHDSPKPRYAPMNITWTYFYGKNDTYSRIDYILLSRGMAREWEAANSYVLALPGWGIASDHRPVLATFSAADK